MQSFSMDVTDSTGAFSTVSVVGKPVNAAGNPSPATLSLTQYVSSAPTVFTVAPDPSTPGGAILSAVAAGTGTLTETATATEPDGKTTEQVQDVATITITVPAAPAPAASLVFTFGTPQ